MRLILFDSFRMMNRVIHIIAKKRRAVGTAADLSPTAATADAKIPANLRLARQISVGCNLPFSNLKKIQGKVGVTHQPEVRAMPPSSLRAGHRS
jgi:hypothetical protein